MYKVLVADDEAAVRNLVAKNINHAALDVTVMVAADGAETLRLAAEFQPDILVTDISMPFYNGLEVIQELKKTSRNIRYIIISGYDEFEYAKQAISFGVTNYLLKPFLPKELIDVIADVLEELDKQKIFQDNMNLLKQQAINHNRIMKERFYKKLLKGEAEGIDTVDEAVRDAYPAGDYYCAGILKLCDAGWDFQFQEQVEEFLLLIKTGYFIPELSFYGVSFDGIRLNLVWWGSSPDKNRFINSVRLGLEKISRSFEKYYHIKMKCVLGTVYQEPADIKASYQEALQIWRNSSTNARTVQLYAELKDTDISEPIKKQVSELKKQITLAVCYGNEEETQKLAELLLDCYTSVSRTKTDYITVSLGELIYNISNELVSQGIVGQEIDSGKLLKERIRYGDLSEIKPLLTDYLSQCCAIASAGQKENRSEMLVKQLKHLVDTNLSNTAVDLDWLAERLHFSPSYIRKLFKQQIGESFGEYLIRKRMEFAGRLLQQTDYQIQKIAAECGYENQRYFASSFKRFYGCTPTEFKKYVDKNHIY